MRQTTFQHGIHTDRSDRSSGNAVHLILGTLHFSELHHAQSDVFAVHYLLVLEFALKMLAGNFSSQSRSFGSVREISAVNRILVLIQGYISPDSSPQA